MVIEFIEGFTEGMKEGMANGCIAVSGTYFVLKIIAFVWRKVTE